MLAQDDTAGRFGWWTNLYQMGVIMLISSQYGGYVLDEAFDHYDRGLREAVAWIMAHSPTKRPTMMQLQDILATGSAKVFNEQERVSIAELLGAPPQP
ncbi:hypothetical protein SLS63_007065 [Diaporthe eres]|uniref:Uncharacterized protein n=1 Tax=Diaporthe eres TaxID=83184 RepID=A0ABR1P6J2_DIAER